MSARAKGLKVSYRGLEVPAEFLYPDAKRKPSANNKKGGLVTRWVE